MDELNPQDKELARKMTAMLVRYLGSTILSDEAHSTPAGRGRAAEMLRRFGQVVSDMFPYASPEDLGGWGDLADEVEAGVYDRELASALARYLPPAP